MITWKNVMRQGGVVDPEWFIAMLDGREVGHVAKSELARPTDPEPWLVFFDPPAACGECCWAKTLEAAQAHLSELIEAYCVQQAAKFGTHDEIALAA